MKKTIQKIKESHLYAEADYYKRVIQGKDEEIEDLYTQIRINETTEHDLILERNKFKEGKEKLEEEVMFLHRALRDKESLIVTQGDHIKTLEKDLLKFQLENNNQKAALSQLEDLNKELSAQNDQLLKDNKNLVVKSERLKTQNKSQKLHINDLNNALLKSEETKKEVFFDLLSKTEELERLIAERKHTIKSLEDAKERLIHSEKEKMKFIKDMLHQYQKKIEENEWWFSAQFADIDIRTKKQEERIDVIEYEKEHQFKEQNEKFLCRFQEVENTFSNFIGEVDSIRDSNDKMAQNLFDLKRLVENQKRIQTHIIQNRPKQPLIENKNYNSSD
ncbi:hypothetical protein [Bacillus sp. Marseille-Q1617]|uniref:coiled-coil domain-containing protein n=1 Tax=Bacillus sp. Marseille-Q1617 TaxID=2736887 RepID=UPI00158EC3A1|nr:hypothetical protein [Bacillus sp. Marseille-Q1617]